MSPGIACVGAGSECKASGAQGEGDLLEVRACATEALAHHEADDLEEGHAVEHDGEDLSPAARRPARVSGQGTPGRWRLEADPLVIGVSAGDALTLLYLLYSVARSRGMRSLCGAAVPLTAPVPLPSS